MPLALRTLRQHMASFTAQELQHGRLTDVADTASHDENVSVLDLVVLDALVSAGRTRALVQSALLTCFSANVDCTHFTVAFNVNASQCGSRHFIVKLQLPSTTRLL